MRPNSLYTTTRPHDSLDLDCTKLQSWNEKIGDVFSNNLGKILSLSLLSGSELEGRWLVLPYMKMFFFLECACKSQNKTTSRSSMNLLMRFLVEKMVGCSRLDGSIHCLFRSTPAKLHRLDPLTTPSIFNMGTILKIKFSLRILASMVGPVK